MKRKPKIEVLNVPVDVYYPLERRLRPIIESWARDNPSTIQCLAMSCYTQGLNDAMLMAEKGKLPLPTAPAPLDYQI